MSEDQKEGIMLPLNIARLRKLFCILSGVIREMEYPHGGMGVGRFLGGRDSTTEGDSVEDGVGGSIRIRRTVLYFK